MRGSSVVRASGRRRVKKSVEACRYVLEMGEGCREDVDEDSDEMEDERGLRPSGPEGMMVGASLG
jgi:hypothetical protein